MFLLQNIRDEAHRFAITENRRLRIKNFDDQTLLSINGVGIKSSDILLKRFKDVSRLSKATYEELRDCLLYTSPSPRDAYVSRMPSSA